MCASKSRTCAAATLGALMLFLTAGAAKAADLTIHVQHLRAPGSKLYVALFDHAEGFPDTTKAVAGQYLQVHGESAVVVFAGLKPGTYAVSTYEDENGNGKLDTNLLGMPLELYGFSRDAQGAMGSPSFEAAAVAVTDTSSITIQLH
jgi:uncharacterized protein (DUF2141 family)